MNTDIVPVQQEERALTKITNYMESPVVLARFAKILGERGASSYVSSALIAVGNSKSLQECSPVSIYLSVLRAATLRLSVDPSTGQAHLVAYNRQATLIPGYKGLYDMAIRTNRYRYINVSKVYEGQEIIEDQITGFHSFGGKRTGDNHIGWIGAFEMLPKFARYAKTIYMTVEQIHQHAQKYSKGYGKQNAEGEVVDRYGKPTIWQTETEKMERKTILRMLLRQWAYMDPADVQVLDELDDATEHIDALNVLTETAEDRHPHIDIPAEGHVTEVDMHPMTIQEARQVLVTVEGKERFMGELTVDELNFVFVKSQNSAEIEAAKLVLKDDYSMEPPTVGRNLRELGF